MARTLGAGEFDKRVAFLRRPPIEQRAGNERGDYAEVFRCWAAWRPLSSRQRAEFGVPEDIEGGHLVVYDTANVETVTLADRVKFQNGPELQVTHVPMRDGSGQRWLRVERKMG
jgi:head-tail adaptor